MKFRRLRSRSSSEKSRVLTAAITRALPRLDALEPRRLLAGFPGPVGAQPIGPLTGKIVYTSAGHGWNWSTTLNRWATDRGDNNEIVEDFGNQDQLTFFADYLFRAGATVVPMRPVGRQTNEVVVDNDLANVTYTGAWSNSTAARRYDEDYGAVADAVAYRFASVSATETATATYTPSIPQSGFYPVYTWVAHGSNRASQLYTINHTGGQFEVRVDHTKVGNGWVYLGTYHFSAGSSVAAGSVEISNQSASGSVVIADAIRFGNGMGDVPNGPSGIGTGSVSGYPREDENSLHWLWRGIGLGITPSSVLGTGNVSAPSNMAQHMNADTNPFGTSVYIGFHSNAGGGRGAVGLIDTDLSDRTPNQSNLALFTGRQINQDMQALNGVFEHNWSTRTTHTFTGQFGEIDLGASAEMDATIIEVAFHDDVMDAALMRDPRVRDQLARSTYEATLEYFNNHGGVVSTTTLPSQPRAGRAVSNNAGEFTISWSAGASSPTSVYGSAPTGYRIFVSTDGYGFDGGTFIPGAATTSATLSGYDPATPLYIKIAAENTGGQSLASEVLTVLPGGGAKRVLLVNGFDRYDRTQNFRYAYAFTGDLLVDRVWARHNNSFDYLVPVHYAIDDAAPGTHIDSASNDAVISGAVSLGDYDSVIWILGNESTVDDTFNLTEQALVEAFVAGGGNIFVSGAEVGWDLDAQNNGRTFYENTLMGNYVADSSGSYNVAASAGGIFAGLGNFVFSGGAAFSSLDSQSYNVRFPDVSSPQPGAATAMTYANGAGGAAIQFEGTSGRGNVVLFGFPFESITTSANRALVMGRVLEFFAPAPTLPAPAAPTLAPGSDSGTSASDGITNINNSIPGTLQFQISNVTAGATVRIYADGNEIGSAVAAGTTVTISPAGTIPDGAYVITATQQASGGPESGASAPLNITVDTAAPTVLNSSFLFEAAHGLGFVFNEDVGPTLSTSDLVVENLTTSQTINAATVQFNYAANALAVSFPGQPNALLPDGNYSATFPAATVTDIAGNALTADHLLNFFFLNGDADRNGTVNLDDFNILALNFGTSGKTFSQGNFSYDPAGNVDLDDFNILASRFGTSLSPATRRTSRWYSRRDVEDDSDLLDVAAT